MKIVRYGAPGLERPGLIAADESLRDLSDHLHDIVPELLAPERIAKLAETNPLRLPKVPGSPRLGGYVGFLSHNPDRRCDQVAALLLPVRS